MHVFIIYSELNNVKHILLLIMSFFMFIFHNNLHKKDCAQVRGDTNALGALFDTIHYPSSLPQFVLEEDYE